jgi:pimeloyl-ACP methyl ester carboxylesterase
MSLGLRVYHLSQQLEATLYGFSAHIRQVGGVTWHYFDNQRDNQREDLPVLILLHGFSADAGVWLRCARHLQKSFRVIIPDLPGHGSSAYDATLNYSVPNQVIRLNAFLTQLGITKCTIAGNSMGGFMAAQYAITFPELVMRIICVDPAGVISPQASQLEQIAQQGHNPFFMDNPAQFTSFYSMSMAKPPFIPKFVLRGIAGEYVRKRAQLEHIFADFYQHDDFLNQRLGDIHCPVLLLWGKLDAFIDISAAPIWQAGTGGISIEWDDLGHMPMLEAPTATAREMMRFLQ